MKLAKGLALALAVGTLSAFSASASAGVAVSTLFANGQNRFSDSSAEVAFSLSLDPQTGKVVVSPVTGTLQTGDYLASITNFDGSFSPAGTTLSAAGANELTAVQLLQISNISPYANTSACGGSPSLTGCGDFTFQPAGATVFSGMLAALGVTYSNPGAIAITNATTALAFEDPLNNYNRDSTIQTGFQTAGDGTLRLAVGLVGANGDYFHANAPLTIADFLNAPGGTTLGNYGWDGTVLGQYFPGWLFASQITGDGSVSTPPSSSNTQFPIFDQSSVTVNLSTVPEPSTLALLGIGLLAAGAGSRRRKRATH